MADTSTEQGYGTILATLERRREDVRARLRELAVAARSARATPESVLFAGGEPLRLARAEVAGRREALAVFAARQEKTRGMLSRLPPLGALHAIVSGRKRQRLEREMAEAVAAYRRIGAEAKRVATGSARRDFIARNGDRIARLREGVGFIDSLEARIAAIRADGHAAPPVPEGPGWLSRLDRMVSDIERLYEPVSGGTVINDGKDHSGLDLSPRSRTIPMLRRRASAADRPWLAIERDDRPTMAEENRLPGGLAGFRLLGRPPHPEPKGLFDIRERRAIPVLPGSYSRADRLYLPVGVERVDEACAAGASLGRRGGFHIDPSKVPCDGPVARFLPFVAQRWYRPLQVEAIPSTSWGASLANLLSSSAWTEIRKAATSRYGGLCQTCGQLRNGSRIECHEIWDYDLDMEAGAGMKVQRLVGLMSVCKACHGVFHQGFSAMRGHGDQAEYRLADINGWSMAELETALEYMHANYVARSKHSWALDLSLVGGGKPLTLDAAKWRPGDGGTVVGTAPGGKVSVTRILGADYRFGAKGEVFRRAGAPQAA